MDTEKNKMIAEFMELIPCDRGCMNCGHYKTQNGDYILLARYDKDWNALMPVAVEIKTRIYDDFWIESAKSWPLMSAISGDINQMYNAVVAFIQYYNDNQKTK